MALQDDQLVQVVSTIWQSVLETECVPTTDLPGASSGSMSACVQITGAWQGAVVLGCPAAFAARAAAKMFGTSVADCGTTDMQDAVAELTNMIGGNFKGLLDVSDACQLSLPAVVAGMDYTTRIPGSRLLHRVALDCGGLVIVVNVLEKLPAACAA